MHEREEIEQYFFDGPTLDDLATLASRFTKPCCLCTPSLGQKLEARGVEVRTLDIDRRFSFLRGFVPYDIAKPEPLGEQFGIIICDPPFLSISLAGLFRAIEVLSQGSYRQPLLINYWSSRARDITRTFAPFRLAPTGYRPGYATIQNAGRNQMELYGNLGPDYPIRPGVSLNP